MITENKEIIFELDSSLRELSAPEVELLLLHCYYTNSVNQLTKNQVLEKKKEYEMFKKAFTKDSILKINNVYKKFNARLPDFYWVVYNYAHKNNDYKRLLMLI